MMHAYQDQIELEIFGHPRSQTQGDLPQ